MREVSVQELKTRFAKAGEPGAAGCDMDGLRWLMHQWRKIGLMYFAERLDVLGERGRIDVCFVVDPQVGRSEPESFVPEPFPVLGDVYEFLTAAHQWDRMRLLTEFAHLKLAHEWQRTPPGFSSSDERDLYCALIDRCYDLERPFRGRKVYWILFDEHGVEFFSAAYNLDPERLEKFTAKAGRRSGKRFGPPLGYN